MVEVANVFIKDLCDVFGCVATPHTQARHHINNNNPLQQQLHSPRVTQRLPFDVESDQESDFTFDDQMLGLPGGHLRREVHNHHYRAPSPGEDDDGDIDLVDPSQIQSGPCILIPFFQSCVNPRPQHIPPPQHNEIPLPLSWRLPSTRTTHHAGLQLLASERIGELGIGKTEDSDLDESDQEPDEAPRVECPVCLEMKLDVVLTCGHAVCRKCLHALFVAKTIEATATHTGGTVWQAKCPKCRLKTPDHRLRRLFL